MSTRAVTPMQANGVTHYERADKTNSNALVQITAGELVKFFNFNDAPEVDQYVFDQNYQTRLPGNDANSTLDQAALDAANELYGTTGYNGPDDQKGPFTIVDVTPAVPTIASQLAAAVPSAKPALVVPTSPMPGTGTDIVLVHDDGSQVHIKNAPAASKSWTSREWAKVTAFMHSLVAEAEHVL